MDAITIKSMGMDVINEQLAKDPHIKSRHTRRGYRRDLAEFEAWRQGRLFTKLLVEEYASELQQQGAAPSTINRKLSAVRWMARRLAELAEDNVTMDQEQREQVTRLALRAAKVENVTGERHERVGRHIKPGEIEAIISTCQADPTPAGVRDAAMFAILYAAGLRRGELVALTMGDVIPQDGEAYDLRIIKGKGDKSRTVPVDNGAALALRDWLALRGSADGPVFCYIRKDGRIFPDHGVTGHAVLKVQRKRAEQAGVPELMLHDWRRTFAGDLLDKGVDLATVADLMGHSSTNTTRNYDRRGAEARRKAVRGLFVPYKPKE